jgi:hypothetical protein
MNSFYSFFDPVDINDSEVRSLYRRRENDPEYKNNPGKLVDPKFLYNFKDLDGWIGQSSRFGSFPVDPHWQKMSDSQRIENGLPTKFDGFYTHPFFICALYIFSGIFLISIKN